MQKLVRILLRLLAVVVALVLVFVGIRVVNGLRYPTPPAFAGNFADASRYPTTQPGMTVEPVSGAYLNGLHLRPDAVHHAGLVVTFGGSEGGCDYERAVRLASQGYEVLALFSWGQANQQPVLADVPLEFFAEVLAWRAVHRVGGPLTVVGTSKGAELALVLQERYPEVDNVVLYAPTRHSWLGLDYGAVRPSWRWRGEPVPYVSTTYASHASRVAMVVAMLLNTPMSLVDQFTTAEAADPGAAAAAPKVVVSGHLLAFAGDSDRMFPSARDARLLAEAAGGRGEAHVYPDAGHLFGAHDGWAAGVDFGGTRAGNEAAQAASDAVLDAALAAWHPAR